MTDPTVLTPAQLDEVQKTGALFFPELFDRREIAILQQAAETAARSSGPNVTPEPTTDSVRMVHGSHRDILALDRLCRHPRLVRRAEQILGEGIYVHQSRLNYNAGMGSGGFEWHQDFSTWHAVDGLPKPRALMITVFLDEVSATNGPLLYIPGSHREGVIDDFEPVRDHNGNVLMRLRARTLRRLVDAGGIKAGIGAAGSVLIMHCNVVHGSTANISPNRRALYYVNVNAVSNRQTTFQRAEFHAGTDFAPLQPVADDALTATAA